MFTTRPPLENTNEWMTEMGCYPSAFAANNEKLCLSSLSLGCPEITFEILAQVVFGNIWNRSPRPSQTGTSRWKDWVKQWIGFLESAGSCNFRTWLSYSWMRISWMPYGFRFLAAGFSMINAFENQNNIFRAISGSVMCVEKLDDFDFYIAIDLLTGNMFYYFRIEFYGFYKNVY